MDGICDQLTDINSIAACWLAQYFCMDYIPMWTNVCGSLIEMDLTGQDFFLFA